MEIAPARIRAILSTIRALPPREWLPEPARANLGQFRSGAYHSNYLLRSGASTSIVRINRSSQWGLSAERQLAREFDVLVAIQGAQKAPIPLAYFPGPESFIVESFIEGQPFRYTAKAVGLVGESIAAVHSASRSAPRNIIPIGDPFQDLFQDGVQWLQKASGAKSLQSSVRILTRFGDSIRRGEKWDSSQVIHTDLIHGNILTSATDCKFVDWEGARFGPLEWDLAYFLSPVTVRWVDGQGDLEPGLVAELYAGYSRVSGRSLDELEAAVRRIMPLVVFRALAWCLGHFATTGSGGHANEQLRRFVDADFVSSVTGGLN